MINTNILNDTFQALVDEGFIYSEGYYNEDGEFVDATMSYGEYAAVNEHMLEKIEEELEECEDFASKYEALKDIVESADDDARMFCYVEDIEEFLDSVYEEDIEDEDGYTDHSEYRMYNGTEIPSFMKDAWEDYQETIDYAA